MFRLILAHLCFINLFVTLLIELLIHTQISILPTASQSVFSIFISILVTLENYTYSLKLRFMLILPYSTLF